MTDSPGFSGFLLIQTAKTVWIGYSDWVKYSGKIFLGVLLLVLISACGIETPQVAQEVVVQDSVPYTQRLENMGLGRYLGTMDPATQETKTYEFANGTTENWEIYHYDRSGAARCYDGGEFVASLRRGNPQSVVLALDGGGACWSYETCYHFLTIAKRDSEAIPKGYISKGLLTHTVPEALLADASVVFGSYCDGSVWVGDKDVVYRSVTNATTRKAYHRGQANASALVNLMKKNYPDPQTIFVTGASAGGYGTLMGYLLARLAYPGKELIVFNDSGPWLFNPARITDTEASFKNWNLDRLIPADCADCADQLLYILDWIFPRDPLVRIGLFMHYDDFTIGTGYLGFGLDFRDVLLQTTGKVHKKFPDRFKRYFTDGIKHTIIVDKDFYNVTAHGERLVTWLQGLIDNSSDWRDLVGPAL